MRSLRLLAAAGVAALAALAAVPATAHAQFVRNYVGGSLGESFDLLAASGTTTSAAVGADFYLSPIIGGRSSRETYSAGTGSSNAGGVYSFGASGSVERALGAVASGNTGTIRFGIVLRNASSTTFTSFDLGFFGEQWRNGGNTAAQTLAFAWAIDPTSLAASTFTTVGALGFTSPVATATAGALNGNAAANRRAVAGTVAGFAWAPGQTLWLRWEDLNDAGNDHALAIDDLTFAATAPQSVVPEPTSVALVGAGLAGVLAAARRRRAR